MPSLKLTRSASAPPNLINQVVRIAVDGEEVLFTWYNLPEVDDAD